MGPYQWLEEVRAAPLATIVVPSAGRGGRAGRLFRRGRPREMASVQSCGRVGLTRAGCVVAWGERGAARKREMKEVVGMVPEDGTMAFCAAGGIRCALGWAGMKSGETLGASPTTRDSERATVWQSWNNAGGLSRGARRAWGRPGRDREDK